jgi:menaquinone-dependent protoporphyrinogen oxidase
VESAPDRVSAGSLAYTRYNFVIRFIMRRIARKEGAPTDKSRDYELTDWTEVARFANGVADELLKRESLASEGAHRPAGA